MYRSFECVFKGATNIGGVVNVALVSGVNGPVYVLILVHAT